MSHTFKPIIFNELNIDRLHNANKTQTRRPVVLKQHDWPQATDAHITEIPSWAKMRGNRMTFSVVGKTKQGEGIMTCLELAAPFCVGDILWVRENYRKICCMANAPGTDRYEEFFGYEYTDGSYKWNEPVDGLIVDMTREERLHPSIHMPKEACRTFLKVTDVRAERVQDISAADAIAEGINMIDPGQADMVEAVRHAYRETWDATLDKNNRDRLCWDANPCVWAYTFEQIDQPEDWMQED